MITTQRNAEPARDRQRDVGDERRVGHAQDDVRPGYARSPLGASLP